ncbi:phosphoglycerate mutase family protein (plasmid) [Kozakia baliensis]|uniref:phosphoglycerate mutase family protein n=1 Tax=Kozakia baliensis TaxID=153496 RepID=UPI00345B4C88
MGESAANAGGATFDPGDIPLSARGEAQARDLANRLTEAPDLIVHSPFLRTYQTAAPTIARYPDAPVVVWPIQEFTYLSPMRCAGTTGA